MTARFPDFFIVGVPKCGTTSLFRYIAQHRSVHASAVKEPNFFCSDFPSLSKFESRERYLDLFQDASDDQICGEASPWYLLSEVAVANILKCNPEAKFIVLMRNPVDAVTSYFRYMRYYLVEEREDILGAILLQNLRSNTPTGVRHRHSNPFLMYQKIFSYAPQIRRIKEQVPENNLLILYFEEFFKDASTHMDSVFSFLGLPSQSLDLTHHNPAQEWKYDSLRRILVKQFPLLQNGLAHLSKIFRRRGINLNRIILEQVTKPGGRLALDPVQRASIAELFKDDVRQLRTMETLPHLPEWQIDIESENS